MRRILAIVFCAAYLAFGSLAGLAHVHGGAGHHEEAQGLHLDHAHPAVATPQTQYGLRWMAEVRAKHVDHHDGDAVCLTYIAVRAPEASSVAPAAVPIALIVERPTGTSRTHPTRPSRPRDPPSRTPPRLRGPPA